MKSFLHETILLGPIEACAHERGAQVLREHPTGKGRRAGFVDRFIKHGDRGVACEAELTPARASNDVTKALALSADLLLIVVPTGRIARAVRARLRQDQARAGAARLTILVAPLGQAIQQLSVFLDSWTAPKVAKSKTPQKPDDGRGGARSL